MRSRLFLILAAGGLCAIAAPSLHAQININFNFDDIAGKTAVNTLEQAIQQFKTRPMGGSPTIFLDIHDQKFWKISTGTVTSLIQQGAFDTIGLEGAPAELSEPDLRALLEQLAVLDDAMDQDLQSTKKIKFKTREIDSPLALAAQLRQLDEGMGSFDQWMNDPAYAERWHDICRTMIWHLSKEGYMNEKISFLYKGRDNRVFMPGLPYYKAIMRTPHMPPVHFFGLERGKTWSNNGAQIQVHHSLSLLEGMPAGIRLLEDELKPYLEAVDKKIHQSNDASSGSGEKLQTMRAIIKSVEQALTDIESEARERVAEVARNYPSSSLNSSMSNSWPSDLKYWESFWTPETQRMHVVPRSIDWAQSYVEFRNKRKQPGRDLIIGGDAHEDSLKSELQKNGIKNPATIRLPDPDAR